MNDPRDMMAGYFEGTLSAEQVAELESYLREDRQRARVLVREAMLECHLAELLHEQNLHDVTADLSGDAEFGALLKALDAPEGAAQPINAIEELKRDRMEKEKHEDPAALSGHEIAAVGGYLLRKALTSKPALYAYAAAVVLLAAVVLIPWGNSKPTGKQAPATAQQDPAPIATLTAVHNAQWSNPGHGQAALAAGQPLYPNQRLTLTQGFAEITTARGAQAVIHAPATVELINNNAMHLHAGRLVGKCHSASSKRFVVQTDHATITDLGTEFGIHVNTQGITATVFSGKIQVMPAGGVPQSIITNQTARLKVHGNSRELVLDQKIAKGFTRLMPRPALVRSATINDKRFKAQVVVQGVVEDAKAFTDREHELNGLDAEGIPAQLLGGDLVLVPADARPKFSKGTQTLQVELDLARPAQVYLLFTDLDAERGIPAWVTRDYERTPMRVGLDRGPLPFGIEKQVGKGPGVSIDQDLQVWKRKQTASGRAVVAGHMKDYFTYTLVVVPKPQAY